MRGCLQELVHKSLISVDSILQKEDWSSPLHHLQLGGAGTNDMSITIPYSQLDAYWEIAGPVAMLSRNPS